MNRIRAGVVGVGHIGKNHARIYAGLPDVDLTAILDNDAKTGKSIASSLKSEYVDSLEAFAEKVDAASISTPTPYHYEIAKFLLERGKHLLIEKPITEDPLHARELIELASAKELILQVGHIERFNPVLSALEQHLRHPRFIESHRLSPYPNRSTEIGVVLDLMIHDIEIILHLVRSPVQNVDCVGIPVLSKGEDIANARIRFENGCVANLTVSRISPEKMRKIRVFQEDAYLSLDYQNQSGEIYRKADGKILRDKVAVDKGEPLQRELAAFIDCARMGKRPAVSGFEATAALELSLEITRKIWEAIPAQGMLTPE